MDYNKCSTLANDSTIVVQENKSRFELKNPERKYFQKIEVDGCLIGEGFEKCDWIIASENQKKRALYIELKGCDIDKAISQLKSTLLHTKEKYRDYNRECYAVTTRIPKHGPSIRKKCLEFYKSTKATLSVKNIKASVEG